MRFAQAGLGAINSPQFNAASEKQIPNCYRVPVVLHWAYTSGMAAAFDTLSAAKELQAAGFEQAQAEAVAQIVRAGQGDLATKHDLAGVHTQMGAMGKEIGALRAELGAIKWVLGLVAALNVAILVRLLLD